MHTNTHFALSFSFHFMLSICQTSEDEERALSTAAVGHKQTNEPSGARPIIRITSKRKKSNGKHKQLTLESTNMLEKRRKAILPILDQLGQQHSI